MTGGFPAGTWIGPDAVLRGTLDGAGDMGIAGEVFGDITLEGELHVAAGGRLRGDVCCLALELSDGATLDGSVRFWSDRSAASASSACVRSGPSRLEARALLQGSLETSGDLQVSGRVEGALSVAGRLTIAEGALVKGAVRARRLVLRGRLEGELWTRRAPELGPAAELVGEVHASELDEPRATSPVGLEMPSLGRVVARRRGDPRG
ncbi:MAG: polymer-forming cytoskeletal protein [Deltaproteobacteria bacterium]|nr:polymer-forming cytoskeletal protein [Deltaproteobacteria bacterium]